MRIGTPLSSSATKVMLLGSGELGKEVIIALQRLGVEVIAVDRYDNAPGHQVAQGTQRSPPLPHASRLQGGRSRHGHRVDPVGGKVRGEEWTFPTTG